MEISTFEQDLLGRREFATRLESFLSVERDYVDGALVVALSAKYGSGKTTFLKMWEDSLNQSSEENRNLIPVFLNAWESDYLGDPLYAIVAALVKTICSHDGDSAGKLAEAAKDVAWFGGAMLAQAAKKVSGVDLVEAKKLAENKSEERKSENEIPLDAFSLYQKRGEAMGKLKERLQEYVNSTGGILFIVDELDRCRPDYAISYMEIIKHIFDIKGAIFILAADRRQLENSARKAFGNDLDFGEYYRKFVHREVPLPRLAEEHYSKVASTYVKQYLQREQSRRCYMELDRQRVKEITQLATALEMTPRQIQESFRMLGHLLEATEEHQGMLRWCVAMGSILMCLLQVARPEIFSELGRKKMKPKNFADFLLPLMRLNRARSWFLLVLSGDGLNLEDDPNESPLIYLNKTGELLDEGPWKNHPEVRPWIEGWGDEPVNQFVEIHEKIYKLEKWI